MASSSRSVSALSSAQTELLALLRRASASAAATASASTSALAAASSAAASLDALAAAAAVPLALLRCSEFGLLLAPHVRGDRVPRVSCGHSALLGGCCCYVEWILHETSCCLSVQRKGVEQEQPELLLPPLLLPTGAAARLWKEMSRRCLGYRIVRP
jgi:hypothetical protein